MIKARNLVHVTLHMAVSRINSGDRVFVHWLSITKIAPRIC
jgi:hypothetical protein